MTKDQFHASSNGQDNKSQSAQKESVTANRPAAPAYSPPAPRPPAPKPPFGMPAMPVAINIKVINPLAVVKTATETKE